MCLVKGCFKENHRGSSYLRRTAVQCFAPWMFEVRQTQDFILVSETLLSPALLSSALTPEECEIIAEYIMSLSHLKHPWSKSLVLRYA